MKNSIKSILIIGLGTALLSSCVLGRPAKDEAPVRSITVSGSGSVSIKPDMDISEITYDDLDGAILPGGMPGTLNLKASNAVVECVKKCYNDGKLVASICAAPSIFGEMGLLRDRRATCFPGFEKALDGAVHTGAHVETDGNVITSKGAGCALEFGHAIVSYAVSKEAADKVLSDMQCY